MPAARAACAVVGALAAATFALAACGSSGSGGSPTWRPKPSFSGEGNGPGGQQPGGSANPAPGNSSGSPSPRRTGTGDPNVVATDLTAPTGIAILPDNTALVGERSTGRIVRVQPQPGQPVQTVRTIRGISTTGGGGLLDLALSPNYDEDNLIFAYITTRTDNRVIAFTLNGPVTPVLTGIPRGASDNTGRLAFLADGTLLVGTGDAGNPSAAQNPASLAGKVLRVTDIGAAAADNPTAGSRVFASGFRESDGLCPTDTGKTAFQTEALDTAAAVDPVNLLVAGGSYAWPTTATPDQHPLATLPASSRAPGGCAVLQHVLYTTSLDGHTLLASAIKTSNAGKVSLGTFVPALTNKYGRLRTVVAASDGALWLTTSNLDGHGTPQPHDELVLRIVPSSDGGQRNPT
jgi:glucose/arabinose dehydrogenase